MMNCHGSVSPSPLRDFRIGGLHHDHGGAVSQEYALTAWQYTSVESQYSLSSPYCCASLGCGATHRGIFGL